MGPKELAKRVGITRESLYILERPELTASKHNLPALNQLLRFCTEEPRTGIPMLDRPLEALDRIVRCIVVGGGGNAYGNRKLVEALRITRATLGLTLAQMARELEIQRHTLVGLEKPKPGQTVVVIRPYTLACLAQFRRGPDDPDPTRQAAIANLRAVATQLSNTYYRHKYTSMGRPDLAEPGQ
jgi:DNA-binding XRE family transcriptional regulator